MITPSTSHKSLKFKILLLLILLGRLGISQTVWLKQTDHSQTDMAYSVANDSLNNWIYVAGSVSGTTAGSSITNLWTNNGTGFTSNLVGFGAIDGYLAKFDLSGNLIWVLNLGGIGNDEVLGVCVGADHNIYLTGYYKKNITIRSRDGSPVFSLPDGGKQSESFIASYDPNGEARWIKSDGGDKEDAGFSITSTSNGVVAIGTFENNGNIKIQNVTPNLDEGHEEYYIAKYAYDGTANWFVSFGSDKEDYLFPIPYEENRPAITSYNNKIYFTSPFAGQQFKFYNSSNTYVPSLDLTSVDDKQDFLFGALDNSGNILWRNKMIHDNHDVRGLAIAADCNGVFVSGLAAGFMTWPGIASIPIVGHDDMFLARLNASTGTMEWNRVLHSDNTYGDHHEIPTGMITDKAGKIYLVGASHNAINLGNYTIPAFTTTDGAWMASFLTDGTNYGYGYIDNVGNEGALCVGLAGYTNLLIGGYSNSNLATSGLGVTNTSTDSWMWDINVAPTYSQCCQAAPTIGTISATDVTPPSATPIVISVSSYSPNITWWYSTTNGTSWSQYAGETTGSITKSYTDTTLVYAKAVNGCGITAYSDTLLIIPFIASGSADATVNVNATCQGSIPNFVAAYNLLGLGLFTQDPVQGTLVKKGRYYVKINSILFGFIGYKVADMVDTIDPIVTCPGTINVNTTSTTCTKTVTYSVSATDNCSFCGPASISGYTLIGDLAGHRYFKSTTTKNFYQANNEALALGAHLVSINSAAENTFLSAQGLCWIGLNDLVTEGTFVWTNGDALSYTNWYAGEPNNGSGNENAGVINYNSTNKWNDALESTAYNYIMEFDCIGTPSLPVTMVSGQASGTNFPAGTTSVLYTATDASSNSGTCSFNVVVTDNVAPTITCPGNQTLAAGAVCSAAIPDYRSLAVVSDNCTSSASIVITQSPVPGTVVTANTLISLTAADASGNSAFCSFMAMIVDQTAPTLTCPANAAVPLSASCNYSLPNYFISAIYSDNCTSNASLIKTQTPAAGTLIINATTVQLSITDAAGLTATCSFTVTPSDQIQPTISCPASQSLTLNSSCQVSLPNYTALASVSDNCTSSATLTRTQSPAAGTLISASTPVTITVTDQAGNSASCTFTVNVVDNLPPSITCPGVQSLSLNASCNATLPNYITSAIVSDGCTPTANITITQSPAPGTIISGTGTTTVTFTAQDLAGNTSTCSFNVTRNETINPVITCPATVNANLNPASCTATISTAALGVPVTSDNCSVASVTNNHPLTTYPVGTTIVQWTVTDGSGLTSTCNQNVIVTDNIYPTISCSNMSVNVDANSCIATMTSAMLGLPVTSDNCSVTSVTNNHPSTVFTLGANAVVWTATDANGNASTCSQNITVVDNIYPTITCASTVTVNTAAGSCGKNISLTPPTVSDNCTTGLVTSNHPSTFFNTGTTVVTWSVSDASGNTSTCSQTVIVTDNIPPVITCPNALTVNADPGSCGATISPATLGIATATDNCTVSSIINDHSLAYYPVGTTTVTWRATDASGNFTTCTQVVTVLDNQNPTITCPTSLTVGTDSNVCLATLSNIGTPIVGENCSIAWVTNNHPSDTYNVGINNVTWTVADINGHQASCTMQITVTDSGMPIVSCPGDQSIALGDSCNIVLPDYTSAVDATDNCGGIITIVQTPTPGTIISSDTNVNFEISDAAGNTSTCGFLLSIFDNSIPTIGCPPSITVSSTSGFANAFVNIPAPDVADNCGIDHFNNDFNGSEDASGTYPVGTTIVTWTVYDVNGLENTCEMSITVNDSQAPVIICPADITQNAAAGQCSAFVTIAFPTVTDNDGVASITNDSPFGTSNTNASGNYPVGETNFTWTAVDSTGNSSTCVMRVTIVDNQPPVFTCPSNVSTLSSTNACSRNVTIAVPTVTDNCGSATITNSKTGTNNASGIYNVGTTLVTWTATDSHGLTTTCIQTVIVSDNQNPTITCPSAVAVNVAPGMCTATVVLAVPATSDNCTVASVTNNHPSTTFPVGVSSVTWTVTDASGRTATCVQTVTVTDNIDPVIACPAAINVNVTPGQCTATVASLGTPITSDNCSVASVTNNHPSTSYSVGTTNVLWTVTDASGRTATCTQTVTVSDNINPTISCPSSMLANVGAGSCTASVLTTNPVTGDNCSVTKLTWTMTGATTLASPNSGINYVGTQIFNLGVTTVTYVAKDAAGNLSTCNFTVSVIDTINPTITCPSNVTVNTAAGTCTATILPVALGTPVATDNCSVASITNNHPASVYTLGTTNVLWTVTDGSGNSATCTQIVTVVDNINPTITCPSNLTVNVNPGSCTATILPAALGTPATSDNCTVASVTNNHPSTSYTLGNTNVIWTVTDGSGRTATCTQVITVVDNINPTIACPANISVNVTAGSCTATVASLGTPITADNCSVAAVTNNHPSTTYGLGVTTVTWTVSDAAGLTATCTQTVTVTDNINPIISCPANVTVNVTAGSCTATVLAAALGTPTATDNCSVASVTNNHPSTTYSLGTNSVIWTVTDGSGRTATCTQTVTVVDNIYPTITCPNNISVFVSPGLCTAVVSNLGTPITSDNCTVASVTNNHPLSTYNLGSNDVIWTVTDGSGNSTTCTQTVTVVDNISPVISCPANLTVPTVSGICSAMVSNSLRGTPTTSDNCAVSSVTNNHPSTSYALGINNVIWTVTDASGNSATCTQVITVVDNTPPTITCPASINVNMQDGSCNATILPAALGTPIASDNCGSVFVANDHPGTLYNPGLNNVTWVVTDASGNTSTCTQAVNVTDVVNPTIICAADLVLPADSATCGATINNALLGIPSVTDNCTVQSTTHDHPSGFYPVGTTVVTWTATDSSGNITTCQQTVTIEDHTDPVIICANDINVIAPEGDMDAIVNVDQPQVTDNCGLLSVINDYNSGTDASGVYPVGTSSVTWTATDINGNTAICTFEIHVFATPPATPTLSCTDEIITYSDIALCGTDVEVPLPITENVVSIHNDYNGTSDASGFYSAGNNDVTWYAYDVLGNELTCITQIVVLDTVAPVISCPPGITSETDPNETYATLNITSPAINENCGSYAVINNLNGTAVAPDQYPLGITTLVWTATDASGNSSTCAMEIEVMDNSGPAVLCGDTIIHTTDIHECQAFVIVPQPSIAGESNITLLNDYNNSDNASDTYETGWHTVNWTITDVNGNNSYCSTVIHVRDLEGPIVFCADTITAYSAPDSCMKYVIIPQPTFTENCEYSSISNTYNGSDNASDVYGVGSTALLWLVSDIYGNIGLCQSIVTVVDVQPPSLSCPADMTVFVIPGESYFIPDFSTIAAVTDECATPVNISQYPPAGTEITEDTEVNITVTDNNGNSTSCSLVITVLPAFTAPTILLCPGAVTFDLVEDCMAEVTDHTTDLEASNVVANGAYTVYQYPAAGSVTEQFDYLDIWVIDEHGLSSDTCHVPAIFADHLAPLPVSTSTTFSIALNENCEAIVPAFSDWIEYADNCSGIVPIAQTPPVGVIYYDATTISATYLVSDASGNEAIPYSFTINIVDINAPVVSAPSDYTIVLDEACTGTMPDIQSILDIDDCSAYLTEQSIATGYIFDGITTETVNIKVWDIYDNHASDVYITIHTVDQTAPVVNTVTDITLALESGECEIAFDPLSEISGWDSCDDTPSIIFLGGNTGTYTSGSHTITYYMTDDSGNQSSPYSFNLIVTDNNGPVFTPLNDVTTCGYTYAVPIAIDCGVEVSVLDANPPLVDGLNTLTFTATDGTNITTYSYNVTVIPMPEILWETIPSTVCENDEQIVMDVTTAATWTFAAGNEMLNDDIFDPAEFGPGSYIIHLYAVYGSCTEELTQNITVLPAPSVNITSMQTATCGLQMSLTAASNATNLQWYGPGEIIFEDDGEPFTQISSSSYGSFQINVQAETAGCISLDSIEVDFYEQPSEPDAGQDQNLYLIDALQMHGAHDGAGLPTWSVFYGSATFDNQNDLNTPVTNVALGENIYVLTAQNNICFAFDTVTVNVYGLMVPTGYSPNGDDVNDAFVIKGIENLAKAELKVFNRWGQLIYQSEDYHNEWAATNLTNELLPDDTYFYELKLDGEDHNGYVIIKR